MNMVIGSSFVAGVGLFYASVSYSNLKYDVEEMRGIPFDSALAEFQGDDKEKEHEKYIVVRIFTNKESPDKPSLSISSMAVGFAYATPQWVRYLMSFNTESRPHVIKIGDTLGKYTLIRKTPKSVVFERKEVNRDYYIGLDLVKAQASPRRDKYYACLGVLVKPKNGSANYMVTNPVENAMYNILLKYSARFAQDLYGGRSTSGSFAKDAIRDVVSQKIDLKNYKKGKRDDMGAAGAENR